MRLYDKYRPADFGEVVGQDKAVRQLRGIAERSGFGGRAVWIGGTSGTGKTTLARIIAETVADRSMTAEYDAGDRFGQADLDEWTRIMELYGFGKGGRALIVNEAHGIRRPIVRQLLGMLERLPDHCVVVFTTTRDGQDQLFEDDIDAGPLLSRCIAVQLTSQGLARAFAERALTIARAEGLDGQPVESYVKLAQKHKNNFRAMLQDIEAGAMIGSAA